MGKGMSSHGVMAKFVSALAIIGVICLAGASITVQSLMDGLAALAIYAVMMIGYGIYAFVYRAVTGRDPNEVYMERLRSDPLFGPAYEATGSDPLARLGLLRAYNGHGGIG